MDWKGNTEADGVTIAFDSHGETKQVELVRDCYTDNGKMAVLAYLSDPADEDFGELWADVTVNLDCAAQHDGTVLLDTNNMGKELLDEVMRLGAATGGSVRSGFCFYPVFAFDADVVRNMRDTEEFYEALEAVYGGE